jgi:hypothetical protein
VPASVKHKDGLPKEGVNQNKEEKSEGQKNTKSKKEWNL